MIGIVLTVVIAAAMLGGGEEGGATIQSCNPEYMQCEPPPQPSPTPEPGCCTQCLDPKTNEWIPGCVCP